MKITETINRDCCQSKDLKPVEGCELIGRDPSLKFCIHCGARHEYTSEMDGAGGRDWFYQKINEDHK